jgi:hypothetical protein
MGEIRNSYRNFLENGHLEDCEKDGRIALSWSSKNRS